MQAVEKMSMIYEALLSLHAEMVLDEALRSFRIRRLYEQIDRALLSKDQESFLKLTAQLKEELSAQAQPKEEKMRSLSPPNRHG